VGQPTNQTLTLFSSLSVLPARSTHTATIVFLHGLGDDGESWADALKDMQIALPHVKIICPPAPEQAVTINRGALMTSWHDIKSLAQIDDEGTGKRLYDVTFARSSRVCLARSNTAESGVPTGFCTSSESSSVTRLDDLGSA
jgi:predicted esterase